MSKAICGRAPNGPDCTGVSAREGPVQAEVGEQPRKGCVVAQAEGEIEVHVGGGGEGRVDHLVEVRSAGHLAEAQPAVIVLRVFHVDREPPGEARRLVLVVSCLQLQEAKRADRSEAGRGDIEIHRQLGNRVAGVVLGGRVEIDAIRAAYAEAHQEVPAEPHIHFAIHFQAERRQTDVEVDRHAEKRQILAEMHGERDVVGRRDELDVVEVHIGPGIGAIPQQAQPRRAEHFEERLPHSVVRVVSESTQPREHVVAEVLDELRTILEVVAHQWKRNAEHLAAQRLLQHLQHQVESVEKRAEVVGDADVRDALDQIGH